MTVAREVAAPTMVAAWLQEKVLAPGREKEGFIPDSAQSEPWEMTFFPLAGTLLSGPFPDEAQSQ